MKTALIVEDEIFVALDLERILTSAGYAVAGIAPDRSTALEVGPACDIAFVDVNLRDGATGPEIARELEANYGVRVVFVTANPAQIGETPPGLGYVRKPFTDTAILSAAQVACHDAAAPSDMVLFTRAE